MGKLSLFISFGCACFAIYVFLIEMSQRNYPNAAVAGVMALWTVGIGGTCAILGRLQEK